MTTTTSIHTMSNDQHFSIGDEVENEDLRFFIGAINDSHNLCSIDKTKPWTVKTTTDPMRKCMEQGNYSVTAHLLQRITK